MDEATASVDRRTDEMLQSFKDGTIIAVAHHLEMIIDYDLVLVLGHGRLLEFGSPAKVCKDSLLPRVCYADAFIVRRPISYRLCTPTHLKLLHLS